MDRLLNVMTLLSLGLIVLVLTSVRRSHIRVEYSVSWLGAATVLLVLSRSRSLLEWLAPVLGLGHGSLVLVMLAFCVLPLLGGDLRPQGREHRAHAASGHSGVPTSGFA
jgi:hypothetical protein